MMRRALSSLLVAFTILLPATLSAQALVSDRTRQDAVRAFQRGQDLMAAEQFEKAAGEFSNAVMLDPLFTLAFYQLGQARMNLRQYDAAIAAFKDCIEAAHGLYTLQETNRFEVERRRTDEINEMREYVQQLTQKGLRLQASQAEQRLHDLESRRTTISGPFRPPAEALLSLGSAYFRSGDAAQAEQEWKAAVDVNPKFGEAYSNLAAVYLSTGRKADAEEAVKQAEKSGYRVNPQMKKDIGALKP